MSKVKVKIGDKVTCLHRFEPKPENGWGRDIPIFGEKYTVEHIRINPETDIPVFILKEIESYIGFSVIYFEPVVSPWVNDLLDRIILEIEKDYEI